MQELPGIDRPRLHALPQIGDRMTFLYLERCVINRQDNAITATDDNGTIHIPASGISVLLLGPGTSVTHRAMELIGDSGVSAVWTGGTRRPVLCLRTSADPALQPPDASGRAGVQHPLPSRRCARDVPDALPGRGRQSPYHAAAPRPGALRVRDWEVTAEYSALIAAAEPLQQEISTLTGLTDEMLLQEGIPLEKALPRLLEFIGNDSLLIHNAQFDLSFLREAARQLSISPFYSDVIDTCALSRKKMLKVANYRLSTLAAHFELEQPVEHRALPDCYTAHAVYCCLMQSE